MSLLNSNQRYGTNFHPKRKTQQKVFKSNKIILDLLIKDPKKRIGIKEVLEHSWIQKFCNTNLNEKRKGRKDLSSFHFYASTDEKNNK